MSPFFVVTSAVRTTIHYHPHNHSTGAIQPFEYTLVEELLTAQTVSYLS